ncbi:MAG: 2Fe-2S iron-sulfur cluster binding domain-containing protein [Chloroflexi bacterium]|nr:2Fe-2S iron-sulfur cluster binding domain-containing protein [Chloroflexota bacterium]
MDNSHPMIELTIDGQTVQAAPGSTILQAAHSIGIDIPVICYHEATTPNAVCRICTVEVTGQRTLLPACVAQVAPGMQVQTQSERARRSRKVILELLASTVDLAEAPEIQAQMADYQADPQRYDGTRREAGYFDDNPFYIRDYDKCILCWRCMQVCADDAQYVNALTLGGRGFDSHIATFYDQPMPDTSCVFCGQCLGVCPTGALKPKRQALMEQGQPEDVIWLATRPPRRKERKP